MIRRRLIRSVPSSRDASLLRRVPRDPDAFATFYSMHSRGLLVWLTAQLRDVDTALDITSEAFAIALERCADFSGETAAEERAWLYAIARNELNMFWRSGRIERRALARLGLERAELSDPEIDNVERLAGIAELAGRLNGALARLPVEQQTAVTLRVVDELDYVTIANRLGISEDSARMRVSRGLRTLSQATRDAEDAS